jgi:hypothetical protein
MNHRGGKIPRERQKLGKYEVIMHPNGGFTYWTGTGRGRGTSVSSPEAILKRYRENNGEVFHSLRQQIGCYGILKIGKYSFSAGKEYLGLPVNENDSSVNYEEVERKIRSFWPQETVNAVMAGEEANIRTIREFSKTHKRQYSSSSRTIGFKAMGGFKGVLEKVYPGFYQKMKRRTNYKDLDLEEIRSRLLDLVWNGEPINGASLKFSKDPEKRRLLKEVYVLLRREEHRTKDIGENEYTKFVASLTGLDKHDIEMSQSFRNNIGSISENLTAFIFSWAPIVGVDLEGIIDLADDEIIMNSHETAYRFGDNARKKGLADIRIGNQGVEVKGGGIKFSPRAINSLIEKYHPGTYWEDGEKVISNLIVFYNPTCIDSQQKEQLESEGIKVLMPDKVKEILKKVIKGAKAFESDIEEVRPRVHSLDNLLEIYDELTQKPFMLLGSKNEEKSIYAAELLKSLIEKAKEKRGKKQHES